MRLRCLRPVNTRNAVTRWQRGRTPREPNSSWLGVPKPSLLRLRDDERRRRSSVRDDNCRNIHPRVWSGLIASRVAGGVPRWEPSGVTGLGSKHQSKTHSQLWNMLDTTEPVWRDLKREWKTVGKIIPGELGFGACGYLTNPREKPSEQTQCTVYTARSCRAGNTWLDK